MSLSGNEDYVYQHAFQDSTVVHTQQCWVFLSHCHRLTRDQAVLSYPKSSINVYTVTDPELECLPDIKASAPGTSLVIQWLESAFSVRYMGSIPG